MKPALVLLSVALVLVACKRRTPPAPVPPPAPVNEPAKAPAPAPSSGGTITVGDQNLPALNQALKAYLAKHKKAPAKLDDLAKEGFIPFLPMAPPGGRYELDAARGEVKLVGPPAK
ncbi:MAG: hypothetical protein RL514_525 [Verrucomicrobiota bacterium]|jgi:hypothetical protein